MGRTIGQQRPSRDTRKDVRTGSTSNGVEDRVRYRGNTDLGAARTGHAPQEQACIIRFIGSSEARSQ